MIADSAMKLVAFFFIAAAALAQQPAEFRWVNSLPEGGPANLRHATFHSDANDAEVGYAIYLPPGYDDPAQAARRYPAVYVLHGGRPGGEHKMVFVAEFVDRAMREGKAPPMIYVFVNGGKLSHYDHEGSLGETAFIRELIPHVDRTYRTIGRRAGRGLEGFSQGGRGTARLMFKHPQLFASVAPMGGGHQYEKTIDENNGVESEAVHIDPPWNNTWELARRYAARTDAPKLNILVAVGTEDQNYQPNLDWMAHLDSLGIEVERVIVEGIPHSGRKVYELEWERIIGFHVANFRAALGEDW